MRLGAWAVMISLFVPAQTLGQELPTTPPAEGAADLQQAIATADLAKLKELAANTEQLLAQEQFEAALLVYGALGERLERGQATPDDIPPGSIEANDLKSFLLTGQGRALAGMDEQLAALDAFKKAMETNADFPPALIARGEMWLDAGWPDRALPDFMKALEGQRFNPAALFGLGKAYVLIASSPGGDPDGYAQGIRPLTRVIDQGVSPKLAEALRLRGIAYSGLFKPDKALADIEKSLQLNADDHETYFAHAIAKLRTEDYAGAIDELTKTIEHYKPKKGHEEDVYAQGPAVKASTYIELGKKAPDEASRKAAYQASIEESQKLYEKFDEKNPFTARERAGILVTRGIGERMLGQMDRAIRTFSQALEANPALGEAYFRRGICLQQIGENKMAISDFRQAAIINYDDPRGNLWEGFVYAKLGDYYEAIRAYGDAIAASDRYTPAYVNRGLAYMMLGDYEKAVADFNDALRIEPTNGDYFFKRGVAYVQLAQLDKASESLVSAIEFDPTHREAYRYMADVMQRLGHADLAEQYRKKGAELEKKPGGP
ncbi:MAG: tetratricopeptide repeat protein [Pirellulales bacterium]